MICKLQTLWINVGCDIQGWGDGANRYKSIWHERAFDHLNLHTQSVGVRKIQANKENTNMAVSFLINSDFSCIEWTYFSIRQCTNEKKGHLMSDLETDSVHLNR